MKPSAIYEPSENGTRTEIHCMEQIESVLRSLGIYRNPLVVLYLIVLCDDDGEIVEVWSMEIGSWEAQLIFQKARI